MAERIYNIQVTPTGRRYCFVVHGYNVILDIIGGPETVGMHPLDILQFDMQQMAIMLSKIERFTPGTPKQLIEAPATDAGRVTLEDVIGPSKPDADH